MKPRFDKQLRQTIALGLASPVEWDRCSYFKETPFFAGSWRIYIKKPQFYVNKENTFGIIMVRSGRGLFYDSGNIMRLAPGECLFHGLSEPYGYFPLHGDVEAYTISFLPSFLLDMAGASPRLFLPFIVPTIRKYLQPKTAAQRAENIRWAENLCDVFKTKKSHDLLKDMRTDLSGFLAQRLKLKPKSMTYSVKAVANVMAIFKRFLQENVSGKITLDEAAREIGMGRTVFAELFKRVTGQSFARYMTCRRLCKALQEILEQGSKLEATAAKYHFANASHLSRTITQHFGKSVLQMRRRRGKLPPVKRRPWPQRK